MSNCWVGPLLSAFVFTFNWKCPGVCSVTWLMRVQFKIVWQEYKMTWPKSGLGILLQLMTSCLTVSDFRGGMPRPRTDLDFWGNTGWQTQHRLSTATPEKPASHDRGVFCQSQQQNTHVVPSRVKCSLKCHKLAYLASLRSNQVLSWESNTFLNIVECCETGCHAHQSTDFNECAWMCLKQACYSKDKSAEGEGSWPQPLEITSILENILNPDPATKDHWESISYVKSLSAKANIRRQSKRLPNCHNKWFINL